MTDEELRNEVARLQAELGQLKAAGEVKAEPAKKAKKNHAPSRVNPGRRYVLLTKQLAQWGRVPAQQQAVANILAKRMEVGKEVGEAEVFAALAEGARSIPGRGANQDPTYLFRYYRGLRNDGKYAGYVARGFLRQLD